jgi:signal peptidase I
MNQLPHTVLKEIGFTLLAEGKILKIKADGYSMYPTIKPGSVIYIDRMDTAMEPAPGEIIAWKKEAGFVVHRLIRIVKHNGEVLFITRGDSCLAEDQAFTSEQLAGKVINVESASGKMIPDSVFSNRKPRYRINRFKVWLLFKSRKLFRIIYSPPKSPSLLA